MRRPHAGRVALAAVAACWLWVGAAHAQPAVKADGEVSRLTMELSDEIYSPFCPGKTLSMCPSPNAAKVRREIQQLAIQGKDKAQIKQTILESYGEEFRIVEPPAQDNAALLVTLGLGLLAACGAIYALSRRMRARGGAQPGEGAPQEDEELSAQERAYLHELREEVEG